LSLGQLSACLRDARHDDLGLIVDEAAAVLLQALQDIQPKLTRNYTTSAPARHPENWCQVLIASNHADAQDVEHVIQRRFSKNSKAWTPLAVTNTAAATPVLDKSH
jgi:hypothetical protein